MNKIVSIITPSFNSAKYISKTIDSVIAQTYPYWEMLIVDDCSTDSSISIIREYSKTNSKIKYLKTDFPSGSPTLPRNLGIKNATGRYIAFLDSDDIWLPTKLERQVLLFARDNVAIVFSNYEKISENNIRSNRIIKAPLLVSYNQLLKGNVIGCLTAIYDTQKVGKIHFQKIAHEDYVSWLSILKLGFYAYNTNTVEALYRVRKQSVSSDKLRVLLWQWNIYRNVEKLDFLKSVYYFINYAFRATLKSLR